jgi:hypothetical protein
MSVASRFPVVPRKETTDACANDMFTNTYHQQYDEDVSPLIVERGLEKPSTVKKYMDVNTGIAIDEFAATETGSNEVSDICKLAEHEERPYSDNQGPVQIGYECYYDSLHLSVSNTVCSQTCGKSSKGNTIMLGSHKKKNSSSTFDILDDEGTMEDVSGSVQKHCDNQYNEDTLPVILEKGFFSSLLKPSSVKQHMDSNNCCH